MATKITKYVAFDGREFDIIEEAKKYSDAKIELYRKERFSEIYRQNRELFSKIIKLRQSEIENKEFNYSSYNSGNFQSAIVRIFAENTPEMAAVLKAVTGSSKTGPLVPKS